MAPNDRCCRICGKIGHFMKDCPMRKKWVESQHTCVKTEKSFIISVSDLCYVFFLCLFVCLRPKHRRDSENMLEDKMDSSEEVKDQFRHRNEHWKKRDALEIRCCFLCGSSSHIKKDCQLYRGPAGSHELYFFFHFATY